MEVEIYGRSAPHCPFCEMAKQFCDRFGVKYQYFDLSKGEWTIEQLSEKVGVAIRTVPAVFVDGSFIGGAAELGDLLRK